MGRRRDGSGVVVAARPSPLDTNIVSVEITSADPQVTRVGFTVPLAAGEHLYGLGERFDGLDQQGRRVDSWTEGRALRPGLATSYAVSPFVLSSRGYGLALDSSSRASLDLGRSHHDRMEIRMDGSRVRLDLIAGPDPADVLRRHAELTGYPPLPPRWAFGVWKSLVGGPRQIQQDLSRLQAGGVALDAVWIYDAVDEPSGFGWPWKIYGPLPIGSYPNLPGLIAVLHRRGLRVLGYLNPFVYQGTPAYDEAAAAGYLVGGPDGAPAVQPWHTRAYVDFTNQAATRWWQARVRHAIVDVGFDGAMQDFGEDAPADGRYANGQPGATMHNEYPVLYARAVDEVARSRRGDPAVFFVRSGFEGSQPYTNARFTGDQVRSWDRAVGLPSVLSAMLSLGLSGWPYVGPDIGGFWEHQTPPAERELWARWVELGALSPTMRDMLGDETAPVGASTDASTLALFATYTRLHARLEDYLFRFAAIAHQNGVPILRPLFVDFPRDRATYGIGDEYLLGDDVLVAPVATKGQTSRRVYLPAGRWQNHWDGVTRAGPAWVSVAAPVEQIPLFTKEGSSVFVT